MNKWSEKQTMIATIAVFAVLVLGLGGWSFYLWNNVVGPKKKQREEKKNQLAAEKQSHLREAALKKELEDLKLKQDMFKEKLPTKDEVKLEAFRRTLTNFATQSNVMITGVRPVTAGLQPPGGMAAQKPFEEVSFNVDVRGNFATLGNFVYLVETHKRLIRVETIDLKPDSTTAAQGQELPKVIPATLNLKLTTYQFK